MVKPFRESFVNGRCELIDFEKGSMKANAPKKAINAYFSRKAAGMEIRGMVSKDKTVETTKSSVA